MVNSSYEHSRHRRISDRHLGVSGGVLRVGDRRRRLFRRRAPEARSGLPRPRRRCRRRRLVHERVDVAARSGVGPLVRRPVGIAPPPCSDATRHVWRRIVGVCAVGAIVYVVVRARRGSAPARPHKPPRWLALRPSPDGPAPPPPEPAPTPQHDVGADAIELFGFAVTCPRCGDRSQLYRWTRGPDDRPPSGACPRCGSAERHVDTGVRRGIRMSAPASPRSGARL